MMMSEIGNWNWTIIGMIGVLHMLLPRIVQNPILGLLRHVCNAHGRNVTSLTIAMAMVVILCEKSSVGNIKGGIKITDDGVSDEEVRDFMIHGLESSSSINNGVNVDVNRLGRIIDSTKEAGHVLDMSSKLTLLECRFQCNPKSMARYDTISDAAVIFVNVRIIAGTEVNEWKWNE
ncbi:hypothetical protein ARMGADRAFT_1022462 [Armillaria gallica]|uniref:Uncharacterized protein n=1 Tax=Armillaria gallica TaxID=47427 RepID=A0A2H3EWU9_ARMGA|nr:hypothetical protein ARMGADRAFT_1022462 [Armillaria gallica]